MNTITISSKGQLVIPAPIRKQAKIKSGDQYAASYNKKTGEIKLKPTATIDEQADRFSSFIKPGTPPLENASQYYAQRKPRTSR